MSDAPRRRRAATFGLPPLPPRNRHAEAALAGSPPRPSSPCTGQTAEGITAWLRANIALGAEVAIRETQAGILTYRLARVVRLGRGRFEVALGRPDGTFAETGGTFYYSGKHCFHPKGQTRVVVPTPGVRAACRLGPCGLPQSLPGTPYSYDVPTL